MAVTVYRNSDGSAPALTGTVGSFVALLDACLVNGYGSKSAAGWTKSFSGTNAADYRMGAANQFYLDVADNGGGTGGAKDVNVRGYEAMTALATGTNPFPTTAQVAAPGLVVRKSNTADGTARAWIIVADNKTFIFMCQSGDAVNRWDGMVFGDFYSLLSADGYRTLIIAPHAANSTTGSVITEEQNNVTSAGHYYARPITGVAGAIQFGKMAAGLAGLSAGSNLASENGPGLDGNYYVSSYNLADSTDHRLRGRLRGVWRMWHNAADGDTFSGSSGDLTGRSFLAITNIGNQANVSWAIETSDTWDTSS